MTAVEFLMNFCLNDLPIEQWNKYNGLFEQAKEIEKNQIIDAVSYGNSYYKNYEAAEVTGENYYKETYSK